MDDEQMECQHCGGPVGWLGTLGNTTYYQCRDCGYEHSRTEPRDSEKPIAKGQR